MVRFIERYDDPERRDRDSRVGGLAVRRHRPPRRVAMGRGCPGPP